MSINTENFDGVTPPAWPAGWSVDSGLTTTATFGASIVPFSSPNAALLSSTLGRRFATFGTPDSNNGDVTTQATFNATGSTLDLRFGVVARSASNAVVFTSGTFYMFEASASASTAVIYRVVSGSATVISTITATLSLPNWYTLTLNCFGTALSATLQRMSDGKFLTSGNTFQSSPAVCNSATDSSIVGSGYAGFGLVARSNDAYTDDFVFSNFAVPVGLRPMRPVQTFIRGPMFTRVYGRKAEHEQNDPLPLQPLRRFDPFGALHPGGQGWRAGQAP